MVGLCGCTDTSSPERVTRALGSEEWQSMLDSDGRLRDGVRMLRVVSSGGVDPELRQQVWPFLLGCHGLEATAAIRQQAAAEAGEELEMLERRLSSEDASARFSGQGCDEELGAVVRRIKLDIARTDPGMFQGESRQLFQARLERLLGAYAMRDPAIGYCQGMSDLLAPFLMIYDDDHRAFMCFVALMAQTRQNFEVGQEHMTKQMSQVVYIIGTRDSELHCHLKEIGAGDGLWAFRMLLVLMRREISTEAIFSFWEMLWAGQTVSGREVLITYAVAAFAIQNRSLLMQCSAVDEVLQLCNSPPMGIDVPNLVASAIAMGAGRSKRRQRSRLRAKHGTKAQPGFVMSAREVVVSQGPDGEARSPSSTVSVRSWGSRVSHRLQASATQRTKPHMGPNRNSGAAVAMQPIAACLPDFTKKQSGDCHPEESLV